MMKNDSNEKTNMKCILTESGDEFLKQIMVGIYPFINTVGIIMIDDLYCDDFEACLRRGAHLYMQINTDRKYFIVLNIDKNSLCELGESYKQNTLIQGQVNQGKWIEFLLIQDTKIIGKQIMMRTVDGMVKLMVDGRNFAIPLFDDNNSGIEILRTNLDNPNRVSYATKDIFRLKLTDDLKADLNRIIEINYEQRELTGHALFIRRGIILTVLNKLHARFADLN
jgi:hypothetical protein